MVERSPGGGGQELGQEALQYEEAGEGARAGGQGQAWGGLGVRTERRREAIGEA